MMPPNLQQKLYDEVTSVLEDKEIDSLNLPKLIYTEAVVSEAMRILPAVPFVGRYCSEDINLGKSNSSLILSMKLFLKEIFR